MTKKDGDFPRVMASRAGALTSLRAIIAPRVNVDLPSIFPEHQQIGFRQRMFLPLRFQQVVMSVQLEGCVDLRGKAGICCRVSFEGRPTCLPRRFRRAHSRLRALPDWAPLEFSESAHHAKDQPPSHHRRVDGLRERCETHAGVS